jgi:hypothetical protein
VSLLWGSSEKKTYGIAGLRESVKLAMEQVSEECNSFEAPVDLAVRIALFQIETHSIRFFF